MNSFLGQKPPAAFVPKISNIHSEMKHKLQLKHSALINSLKLQIAHVKRNAAFYRKLLVELMESTRSSLADMESEMLKYKEDLLKASSSINEKSSFCPIKETASLTNKEAGASTRKRKQIFTVKDVLDSCK